MSLQKVIGRCRCEGYYSGIIVKGNSQVPLQKGFVSCHSNGRFPVVILMGYMVSGWHANINLPLPLSHSGPQIEVPLAVCMVEIKHTLIQHFIYKMDYIWKYEIFTATLANNKWSLP